MYYHEEKRNLLSLPQGWAIAHCISADFSLGAGVAKQIDDVFNMKEMLNLHWGAISGYEDQWDVPCCLPCLNVFNLVTKEKHWHKPTLDSLRSALEELYDFVVELGIKKLAMPKIGCGLDRLDWEDVSPMIQEIFQDCDVEIMICYL